MASRRDFIKTGCKGCAGLLTGGILLQSCGTTIPMFKDSAGGQQLLIPSSAFTDEKRMLIVRSAQLENDILLLKNNENYRALYLQCTHEGVGLTPTAKKIVCTAHGSTFDFEGNVQKEPALKPLMKFRTETKDTNIIIHLT